jgi:hypothetical protein
VQGSANTTTLTIVVLDFLGKVDLVKAITKKDLGVKKSTLAFILIFGFLPLTTVAQDFGSPQYCSQLANIGANAVRTKLDGYPLSQILQAVGELLAHDQQKRVAAEGVVRIVYGDSSLKSPQEAYDAVYSSCLR